MSMANSISGVIQVILSALSLSTGVLSFNKGELLIGSAFLLLALALFGLACRSTPQY